ncbi:MAG: hypothetical protein AAGE83_06155 [Pseudomonadota bacterium]
MESSDRSAVLGAMAWVWPALAVLGPAFVYFGLTRTLFDAIGPDEAARATLDGVLQPNSGNLLLAEFPGRMSYTLSTFVLFAAAFVGMAYTVIALYLRRGAGWAGAALLTALIAGVFTFVGDEKITAEIADGGYPLIGWLGNVVNAESESIGETLRAVVVTVPMATLPTGQAAIGDATIDQIMWLTASAAAIGLAATGALLIRFAEIAWSPPEPAEDEAEDLRQRWAALRNTLLFGAVILTLAVVATSAYYAWPQTLLTPESAALMRPIAASATGFWGTLYTLILISTSLPAILALNAAIEAEARLQEATPERRKKWRADNMLQLNPQQAISGVLATAAPLITSPLLAALPEIFK